MPLFSIATLFLGDQVVASPSLARRFPPFLRDGPLRLRLLPVRHNAQFKKVLTLHVSLFRSERDTPRVNALCFWQLPALWDKRHPQGGR